jgi:hypothetical protein
MLASMGAEQFVLLGLDGTGDYSFVGVQGLLQLNGPNSGKELSQIVAGTPTARLTGLLVRNRQSNLAAGPNGSPVPGVDAVAFQPSLQRVLAQPDHPFPPFDTAEEQAAERYIACNIGLAVDPVFGIRGNYWQDASISWTTEGTDLANLTACVTTPCASCPDAAAFTTVKSQLTTEFAAVHAVRDYFTGGKESNLFGLWNMVFTGSTVTFTGISTDIMKLWDFPPQEPQGNTDDIIDGALTVASGLTGMVPIAGSFIAGSLNIARREHDHRCDGQQPVRAARLQPGRVPG